MNPLVLDYCVAIATSSPTRRTVDPPGHPLVHDWLERHVGSKVMFRDIKVETGLEYGDIKNVIKYWREAHCVEDTGRGSDKAHVYRVVRSFREATR